MGEKEKHPWKPPELAPPMPDFDDFSNQCVAENTTDTAERIIPGREKLYGCCST